MKSLVGRVEADNVLAHRRASGKLDLRFDYDVVEAWMLTEEEP
jgi:hypothetical protein